MSKVTIESIYINDTKQDGSPMINKNNEPFKMANLKFNGKSASMYIGKFGDKDLAVIQTWKSGDVVDIILEESGQYLNFKLPNKTDIEIESIKFRLARIEGKLGLESLEQVNTPPPTPKPLTSDSGASGGTGTGGIPIDEPLPEYNC